MSYSVRLQLGCGNDPKPGWINHDLVQLEGVDIVHDLHDRPWPWADNSIDEIWAKDVLEHRTTHRALEVLYNHGFPTENKSALQKFFLKIFLYNCYKVFL